jgi:hypothetical protein
VSGLSLLGLSVEVDADLAGVLLCHGRPVLQLQGHSRVHPNLHLSKLVGGCIYVDELDVVLLIESLINVHCHVLLDDVRSTELRSIHSVTVMGKSLMT